MINLRCSVGVGMLRQNAPASSVRYPVSVRSAELYQCLRDVLSVVGHEDLAAGLEELIDSLPGIAEETRTGAGGFKDTGRWREPIARHAVTIDVKGDAPRAEEGVVLARAHVTNGAHIGRHWLVLPTRATEQESALGQQRRRTQEELFHARFAVWKSVAKKAKVTCKIGLPCDGVMHIRIKRVVNRQAEARADALIAGHDGIATAVGEHGVIAGNGMAKMVIGLCRYRLE